MVLALNVFFEAWQEHDASPMCRSKSKGNETHGLFAVRTRIEQVNTNTQPRGVVVGVKDEASIRPATGCTCMEDNPA